MRPNDPTRTFRLTPADDDRPFEGIGAVSGGGATAVLLKDYPEPQRSQILDLVYSPQVGASVSAMLVEIPGDGNSTQGSMPSHQHTRDDLDHSRGYMWWLISEAKARNPRLTLDATAWSAPGWIGDGYFWHEDAADYYLSWMRGLRDVYGIELDAIGCRNEKGVDIEFAKALRRTLDRGGFSNVALHAFDNWPADKFDFIRELEHDVEARDAIDIIGAHVLHLRQEGRPTGHAPSVVQRKLARWGKRLWNTEDHVYKSGFDCLISIVECFNENFLMSGATRTVLWYDVAGLYPIEPYAVEPAMLLAHSPWSGHYSVREALWGYAHYGQFTDIGWSYLENACGLLPGQGSVVSVASPAGDYSIIIETKDATATQEVQFLVGDGLKDGPLTLWRSTASEQFIQLADVTPSGGVIRMTLEPGAVYSLSTTRGQQKGGFADVPDPAPFPLPYSETFDDYERPEDHGHLPRYTADIAGAFELVRRPDGAGRCLRQTVPRPTISWAPDWKPYTILGDQTWSDYEVAVDVWLADGESAAVLARVNHVGTGYGFVPQCYALELTASTGRLRLLVIRGRENKKRVVGDAEQQAIIAAADDHSEGGELELAAVDVATQEDTWHRLVLRCGGPELTGLVDGQPVLTATNTLYGHGQVGLLAGGPTIDDPVLLAAESRAASGSLSMAYFANLAVSPHA